MSEPVVTLPGHKNTWTQPDPVLAVDQPRPTTDRAQGPSTPLGTKLGLLVAATLLAAGWHRTMSEMWLRWFPAWPSQHLALADRLTDGDSYYSHGPLVPFVSLVLAFFVHKRVGFPTAPTRLATRLGWLVLVVSVTLHLMSVSPGGRVMFVSGFALIGTLVGLVLLWGGLPAARAYGLPLAMLLFMVPLPEVAIVDINFRLKFLASGWAIWATNHVFGIPALLDGSYIYLPPDTVGQPKLLVIESVCSGLRSLIALVWFAALFAIVCRLKGLWRWLILLIAVPVAIVCNVVRIASLILVACGVNLSAAKPGGWFHDLSGLLVFAVALSILLGFEKLVTVLSRWWRRAWIDDRLLAFLDRVPKRHAARFGSCHWLSLGLVAIVAGVSVYWSVCFAVGPSGVINTSIVPPVINIDGTRFVGQDHQLDAKSLIILEHPDYLLRTYNDAATGRSLDLLVVFSANNRKGTHPPEVCIEGGGHIVVEKRLRAMRLPGMDAFSLQELLTQKSNNMTCYLYTYRCNGWFTPSFFVQQFWIFMNGLTARDTFGALVRLSVSGPPQSIESSRGLAMAGAKELLPYIDRGFRPGGTP